MEIGLKNALIHHAGNVAQLSTLPVDKFAPHSEAVNLLIQISKAVVDGLKNEVDPDVLLNSIGGMFGDPTTEENEIGKTEISDLKEAIDLLSDYMIRLTEKLENRWKLSDERYDEAKNLQEKYLPSDPQIAAIVNAVNKIETENQNQNNNG